MSLYDVTMPILGTTDCCRCGLSTPDAAMTCARLAQASLPRAGSTSFRLRVRSRYSPRAAAERPPIRSVTSMIVSLSFGALINLLVENLLVPAVAVSLGQCDRGRGPPGACRIRLDQLTRRAPARLDAVDPVPRRLDLVATDEQRRVSFQCIQQQSLISDARTPATLVLGQRELERHPAKAHALETGLFAENLERHAFFGLQFDDEPIGLQRRFGGRENVVRHRLELNGDVRAARLHALARTQVKRNAGPAPVVDFGAQRDEGLRLAIALRTFLLVVTRHGNSARTTRRILAAHGIRGHGGGGDRTQTADDLGLFVANFVRLQQMRRLH